MNLYDVMDELDELRRRVQPSIIVTVGVVREQLRPALPTPKHQGWPNGRLIMALTLTDSQQSTLSLSFADKRGNPTTVHSGTPSWLVDNPAVLALTPSADGLSCLVASVGPIGSATVTVNATITDSGSPVNVSGTLGVSVVSGAPTQVVVNAGPPVEQPTPPNPTPPPANP